jgi:type II secretory pathway pseudopilin PulG
MSLIEVTVVMVIIGLLSLAASMTYSAFAARANDVSAIASLRYVIVAQATLYQSQGGFSDDPEVLATKEPSFTYTQGPVPPKTDEQTNDVISVLVGTYEALPAVFLAARQDDTCIVAVLRDPVAYGEDTGRYTIPPNGACEASQAEANIGEEPW